jgi:hypothetical protein
MNITVLNLILEIYFYSTDSYHKQRAFIKMLAGIRAL